MVASRVRGATAAADAALVARLSREQAEGAARLAQMDSTAAAIVRNAPAEAEALIDKLYAAGMIRRTPEGYEVNGLPLVAQELTRYLQEKRRKESGGHGA
jgi:hypothetical protein